jgi:para-nitrobenzyl esterase
MDVIVVTANYRTGAMGFLALPELSQESPHESSGNYGLLDILMATNWIRDNARAFGGDPGNITLFGQSSGAYDIQLLMTSPLSKGLFHRAITESGQITSYYGAMPKAEAEQLGATVADALNAPQGSVRLPFLRGLPAGQVATAAVGPMATTPDTETGLLTNVDGWVLPTQPVQVFAEGKELPIPLIDGNNAREVTDTITYGYAFSNAAMQSRIGYKYSTTIDDPALAQQAIVLYGVGGSTPPPVDPLFGDVGSQWITDTLQRCGTVAISRYHSAHYPMYQYQFDRNTPGMEARGAFHTAEIPFVFGNPGSAPWTAKDLQASNVVQQYWTNFARTGDPNGGSLPTWPRYDVHEAYMEFLVDGFAANEKIRAPYCEIFRQWVSEYFLEGCWPGREPKRERRAPERTHSAHDDCPASHAPPPPPNYPH